MSSIIPARIFKTGLFPFRRLILIYLTTAIAIIGVSELSLYFFIIRSLDRQSNHELLVLVQIAAPSLDIVKTEGLQNLDREIPWQNLFAEQERSLEWFDSEGKLLAREGMSLWQPPLKQTIAAAKIPQDFPLFKHWNSVRTITIPVYANNSDHQAAVLEGYIRASESTKETDLIRYNLQLGLALGGTIALILISISSVYLTNQTLMPVKLGIRKLKRIATDVSHHLRTPLTRISMATEILLTRTDKIQPSDTKKLKIINSAVEQLKRLIEDLLFLVRIDLTTNLEELEFTDISLNRLLRDLKMHFDPQAEFKNIDLQLQIDDNLSIRGDTTLLSRLLTNLLDNAFDYTESGGEVRLSARLEQETVAISVRDTGIGIANQDLPFIFQHFWRGERAKSERFNNSGLGLTIAHTVVRQHRGTVEVDSQLGQGSCFTLYFPV